MDPHCLVVVKPAGMLSVPGLDGSINVAEWLQQRYPQCRTVHRLDRGTSGLMVFALDHPAQVHLNRQFERREVHKCYIARVQGRVRTRWGEIALPLAADWPNRPRQRVDFAGGRCAQTLYRVIDRTDAQSLLELYPRTGRSHQLRVHCQALGHPILGDPFYGCASTAPRLLLHASGLAFTPPGGGPQLTFNSPAPFV